MKIKKILANSLSLFSLTACQTIQHQTEPNTPQLIADESTKWYLSETGKFLVQGILGFSYDSGFVYEQSVDIWAEIYFTKNKQQRIGFETVDEDCFAYQNHSDDALSIYFNGIKVQMKHQCIDKNIALTFPKTDEGAQYLMAQFKDESKDVLLKEKDITVYFSTKNFNFMSKQTYESIGGI